MYDSSDAPRLVSRRQFNDLNESEIRAITERERDKLENSTSALIAREDIESRHGSGGVWEQHWISLNHEGSRVYADIYYRGDVGIALTADGRIVNAFHVGSDDDGEEDDEGENTTPSLQ